MKENILINSVKEARIYYKERKHKKEAEAYLENISNKKISKEYKKAIDEYWSRYRIKVSGRWHHLFALCSGIEDVRYIDVGLFYSRIIGRLNFQRFSEAYDDKCRYDAMFDDIKQPKTIVKNVNGYFFDEAGYVISKDTAETAIREYGKCIAKPSIGTSGGHGIVVLNRTDEVNYKEGLNKLLNKKNYIVQEFIGQNPVLMDLNPSSVNTIRLMSFLWKGEVYILAQHLRIGNKGSEFVSCTTECRGIEAGGLLSDISHTADYRMRKCVVVGGGVVKQFCRITRVSLITSKISIKRYAISLL